MPIHNEKRALHQNTEPLIYDAEIEASAQKYAEYLAANGLFEHGKTKYGENLYYSTAQGENSQHCNAATVAW